MVSSVNCENRDFGLFGFILSVFGIFRFSQYRRRFRCRLLKISRYRCRFSVTDTALIDIPTHKVVDIEGGATIGRASEDEKTREQAFPGGSDCKHAKLIVYTDMFGLLICYFYMVVSVSELST